MKIMERVREQANKIWGHSWTSTWDRIEIQNVETTLSFLGESWKTFWDHFGASYILFWILGSQESNAFKWFTNQRKMKKLRSIKVNW